MKMPVTSLPAAPAIPSGAITATNPLQPQFENKPRYHQPVAWYSNPLQLMVAGGSVLAKGNPLQLLSAPAPVAAKGNLPEPLRSGVEQLSGYAMDDVNVHYNSPAPAQLQALAFAQGTTIHVGPGQEQHLAHEAWHVVQQKQGRVQATTQLTGGVPVNDEVVLEKEADEMGAKAIQQKTAVSVNGLPRREAMSTAASTGDQVAQRRSTIAYGAPQNMGYNNPANGLGLNTHAQVASGVHAALDFTDTVQGSGVGNMVPALLMVHLNTAFPNRNWVQGHLLNSNLGGLGINTNLMPITGEANGKHTWNVEQDVKRQLYGQPAGGNFELANHGYVEYTIAAAAVAPPLSGNSPDVDFNCSWRHQLPQAGPVAPGAAPLWSAWQNQVIQSRTGQTVPVVPAAWAPFGNGLGMPLAGGGVVNAAIWNIAHVAPNPAFIAAIGGAAAWAPPPGAVQVLTQLAPAGGLKIIGWQM